eukprot:g653.t1
MGAGASTGADAGANASTGGATDGGTNGGEPGGLPDGGMPDGGIGDMNIPEQKPLQVPEVSSLLPLSQAAAANRPNVGGSSAGFNRIIEEEQGNRLNFVREALADADDEGVVFNEEDGIRTMGSAERYFEMMKKFATDSLPSHIAQITEAYQRGDLNALHHASHSLKGAAGFIGAAALAKTCGQLMEACPEKTSVDDLAHWQMQFIDELMAKLLALNHQCNEYFVVHQNFLETYQGSKGTSDLSDQERQDQKADLEYTKNKSVLVAEDNSFTAIIVMEHLKNTGIKAQCASDGMEAVKMYTADPQGFDLILMDCQMDVMDGYQATRVIRRWEASHQQAIRQPGVAIVGLSAYDQHRQKSVEGGMDGFATKPIGREKLNHVIASTLRSKYEGGGSHEVNADTVAAAEPADPVASLGDRPQARLEVEDSDNGHDAAIDLTIGLGNHGSQAFFEKMMKKFLETDLPASMKAIREAISAEDFDSMYAEAHSLKSTSGFVGARHLSEVADQLQVLVFPLQTSMHTADSDHGMTDAVGRDLSLCMQMLEDEYLRFVQSMDRIEASKPAEENEAAGSAGAESVQGAAQNVTEQIDDDRLAAVLGSQGDGATSANDAQVTAEVLQASVPAFLTALGEAAINDITTIWRSRTSVNEHEVRSDLRVRYDLTDEQIEDIKMWFLSGGGSG